MQLFGRERDVATFIGNFERMALRNVSSAEQKPISCVEVGGQMQCILNATFRFKVIQ